MNDKRIKDILKNNGLPFVFSILVFCCAYQYGLHLKEQQRNLDDNAAPRKHMPDHSPFPAQEAREYDAEASERVYKALSGGTSEADVFNDNLDEYLEDPEDEITFPSEIYDTQIDDEEEDVMTGDIHY